MRSLRVAVIGGGPAGLFLGRLLRLADPATTVDVYERRGPDEAFGFGVVFSDRTMTSFSQADPVTHDRINQASVSWKDMEIRLPTGTLRYGGYGFTAISRHTLLRLLQETATEAGVRLHFHRGVTVADFPPPEAGGPDVIVLADGVGSVNRHTHADRFGSRIEAGTAKYIWFGTRATFDAVTFPFVMTPHGPFAAHAYPYSDGMSTFIVEVDEQTWRAAGLAEPSEAAHRAGGTDEHARQYLSAAFAEHLGGEPLIGNKSRWLSFRVVHNARWSSGNLVLVGDAAHTAHFSVGSGTKLAMEDAIALAEALRGNDDIEAAFSQYEATRRRYVTRTQQLAERSMHWWETFHRRLHLPPSQFGLHFITRTDAIGYDGLRRRHADRIDEAETEFLRRNGGTPGVTRQALELPLRLGSIGPANRLVGVIPELTGAQVADAAGRYGLLLADWGSRRGGRLDEKDWRAAVKEAAAWGTSLGVAVDVAADGRWRDTSPLWTARDAGVDLVELVLSHDETADEPALTGARAALPDTVIAVGLPCPAPTAWHPDSETIIHRCQTLRTLGATVVHLRSDGRPWPHVLDWADRIRTDTKLLVLLDAPQPWQPYPEGAGRLDPSDEWSIQLHLAVVTGRADLIATTTSS